MALFTRGLTKVARLGVNSRIGAAVACYHKNVRLLFSLVFNFTRCRIATVVSRETQIILYVTENGFRILPSSGLLFVRFLCIFRASKICLFKDHVVVIERLIARIPDFVLAVSRNVNTALNMVIFGLLHSQVFCSCESKSSSFNSHPSCVLHFQETTLLQMPRLVLE